MSNFKTGVCGYECNVGRGEDVFFPSEGTWHSIVNNDNGLGLTVSEQSPAH